VTTSADAKRPGATNGWAIAAFVLGILGGTILSVIFAIVALVQVKGRHQRGRGLAIAALVISAAWIAAIASVIGYGISAQGTSVRAADLRTGDCIKDAYERQLPTWVKRVSCDRPHHGEVFAVLTPPGDCGPRLSDYAPNSPEGPVFQVAVANNDQSVVCVAMSAHERWSSLRD
jgi:MFS family permease